MMEKVRLAIIAVLLSIWAFIIDQDTIILNSYVITEADHSGYADIFTADNSTYGDMVNAYYEHCMNEDITRIVIDRFVGFQPFRLKSRGQIVLQPLDNCRYYYKLNSRNVLMISDDNEEDSKNINVLDSDKSIYNKLMFHYMNYGARPVYAEKPEKVLLKVLMSGETNIEVFNRLISRVAIQCRKLDENFPNMIPAFVMMLEQEITPPPTVAPPQLILE